jgi:Kdo2-lipid IVA lauroyltransferase/acyltransferase
LSARGAHFVLCYANTCLPCVLQDNEGMFLLRLISRLPVAVLYHISDIFFLLSYHVVRYRRNLVKRNLRNSFPEKTKAERARIEREYYHNLCDYAVETLKLLTIKKEDLEKRVVFTNTGIVEKYKSQNQSVLMLASHQFNWEWMLAAGNINLPMPLDFVYQPINSKLTDRLLLACRTRFGAHAVKRNELAREIIKRRHVLRGTAIVADQYPGQKRDKRYITTFLNQETAFFYGTNQLAAMTQYPVLFTEIRKVKRGFYEVTFVPLAEPPYEKNSDEIIDRYAKAAENLIHQYPAGWLWSHNRWKKRHLTQASAKYPPASTAS